MHNRKIKDLAKVGDQASTSLFTVDLADSQSQNGPTWISDSHSSQFYSYFCFHCVAK